MPDVPRKWLNWTTYDGPLFSLKVGFVPIVDYSAFHQDDVSVSQVGKQDDQWNLRSGRISIGGLLKFKVPITYFASVEYKGLDRPPGAEGWAMTDVKLSIPVSKFGRISVGKIKETFSYEMVGDAANLPQLERILNPFFTSRNIGVRVDNVIFKKKMTYAAGWFNDWWARDRPYDGSSNHFTGRITVAPMALST